MSKFKDKIKEFGKKRPHILFILTDQQRVDCLSNAGHPAVKTPNIDRIAEEGICFNNSFTTSPLCVPARISMVNGLYPHNSNCWQNDQEIPLDSDSYFKHLKKNGYSTCAIGKNHLFHMENVDLYENHDKYKVLGLDHIEDMSGTWGCLAGKSIYTDYLEQKGLLSGLQKYLSELEDKKEYERRYTAEPLPIPAEDYIDSFVARRVEKYVDEYNSSQPSFVFVGFQGPHEPWDAPEEYTNTCDSATFPDPIYEYEQGNWLSENSQKYHKWAQYIPRKKQTDLKNIAARYFGKISQIDDSVGKILETYEKKGWLANTVIIFSSDHGEMLGDHNRLSKSVFYDSAIRVPLIIRLPEKKNKIVEGLVETIDLYQTILELAGADTVPQKDSISLLPLINGSSERIRDDILSEAHVHYMLRTEKWKIIIGRDGETIQLFDLQNDPLEQKNLCGHPDYRQQKLEMRSRMLTRITSDTLRPGKLDPELSSHFSIEEAS